MEELAWASIYLSGIALNWYLWLRLTRWRASLGEWEGEEWIAKFCSAVWPLGILALIAWYLETVKEIPRKRSSPFQQAVEAGKRDREKQIAKGQYRESEPILHSSEVTE